MSRPGLSYEPPIFAWNVGSIIQELAERAGIPYDRINTDILEGYVEGFSTNNSQSAAAAIEALAAIYQFDHANFDGILNYVPRGAASVADIAQDELVDERGNTVETSRRDPISVPRTANMVYYDTDGDLTADKQTSDRTFDGRSKANSTTETTVIMRANDAARAIVISHKVSIEEQRGDVTFTLPDSHLDLTVSDCVRLEGIGRVRITDENLDEGVQKYVAAYDRRSAYTSNIQGLPITPPVTPPSLVVGETRIEFLDIPPLSSSDDVLGYYMAVASLNDNWTGAVIEFSRDGGQTWVASDSTRSNSVMGRILDPLPAAPVWYPDETRVVRVELLRSNMSLVDATFRDVLSRANLAVIGDELINFMDATQVTDTVWELRGLLRGRKHTPIPAEHPVGTRFVLVREAILDFMPAELFDLNRTLTFRATSIGAEAASQTISVPFVGRTQREAAAAYVDARRVGGSIQVSWQGVGRLGGGSSVGMGQFFAGYEVWINSTLQPRTLQTGGTYPDPGGPVTVYIYQVNSITGRGPVAIGVVN